MSTPLFSPSYREARARFVQAAEDCGAQLHRYAWPLMGAQGEELAMDVAVHGPADAAQVLMTTSAVHGIEGFCVHSANRQSGVPPVARSGARLRAG